MGLGFRTLRLFLDSLGLGFEGRYPGRLWVLEWLENTFRASFSFGTTGKCILDFVCYFPKVENFGMTSLCGLFLVCYCWKLNNMLNLLKIC